MSSYSSIGRFIEFSEYYYFTFVKKGYSNYQVFFSYWNITLTFKITSSMHFVYKFVKSNMIKIKLHKNEQELLLPIFASLPSHHQMTCFKEVMLIWRVRCRWFNFTFTIIFIYLYSLHYYEGFLLVFEIVHVL